MRNSFQCWDGTHCTVKERKHRLNYSTAFHNRNEDQTECFLAYRLFLFLFPHEPRGYPRKAIPDPSPLYSGPYSFPCGRWLVLTPLRFLHFTPPYRKERGLSKTCSSSPECWPMDTPLPALVLWVRDRIPQTTQLGSNTNRLLSLP